MKKPKSIYKKISKWLMKKQGGAIASPYSFIGMLWRVCDAAQIDFSKINEINHQYQINSSLAKYFYPTDFKHENHITFSGQQNNVINVQEDSPSFISSWWST